MRSTGLFEDFCTYCSSTDIITDHATGDTVCRGCGVVASERLLDASQEWRSVSNGERLAADQSR